jgi:hypothetical protein
MVRSIGSLIIGILCLAVSIVISIIDKTISIGTIALCIIAIVCIYNALKSG